MAQRVLICGGGVGGLTAALALSRAGHEVTVIERDPLEPLAAPRRPSRPSVAAPRRSTRPTGSWPGCGHAARALPRRARRAPGGRRHDDADDGRPRRAAAGRRGPEGAHRAADHLRVGAAAGGRGPAGRRGAAPASGVDGLVSTGDDADGPPGGVRRAARRRHDPRGRRGRRRRPGAAAPSLEWLAALDVDVPETIRESGLMYLTRWYALPAAALAARPEARRRPRLREVPRASPATATRCRSRWPSGRRRTTSCARRSPSPTGSSWRAASCPGPTCSSADGPPSSRSGRVRPMGGLLNRIRRFTDERRPARSSSGSTPSATPTRLHQPALRPRLLARRRCRPACSPTPSPTTPTTPSPGPPPTRPATRARCEPWYESAVQMDQARRRPRRHERVRRRRTPTPARRMAAVFVAAATDPIIGRGLARFWNLLRTPARADGRPGADGPHRRGDGRPRRLPRPPPSRAGPPGALARSMPPPPDAHRLEPTRMNAPAVHQHPRASGRHQRRSSCTSWRPVPTTASSSSSPTGSPSSPTRGATRSRRSPTRATTCSRRTSGVRPVDRPEADRGLRHPPPHRRPARPARRHRRRPRRCSSGHDWGSMVVRPAGAAAPRADDRRGRS